MPRFVACNESGLFILRCLLVHAGLIVRIAIGAVWTYRVLPVDPRQIRTRQISAAQVCTVEVRARQKCTTEICAGQIGKAKV